MNKLILIISSVIVFWSTKTFTQSQEWKVELGQRIIQTEVIADNLITVYGESNGQKVVKSNRIFPDVIALNALTGETVWELKNPIDRMGVKNGKSRTTVKFSKLKGTDYIKFGHLLVVNPVDGKIIFDPTAAGITSIVHSKVYPEGILASVQMNRKQAQIFIPFKTFKIAWTKNTEMDKSTNKMDLRFESMMRESGQLANSSKKENYQGIYYNGNYIVQHFKDLISYDLMTGEENWKYRAKKYFTNYKISKNKNGAIIYCTTNKGASSGKNILFAINIDTGTLLWEKNIDFSISDLITLDKDLSVLIEPLPTLKKRYLSIIDKEGNAVTENSLRFSFKKGIIAALNQEKGLVLVIRSGEKSTPMSVDLGFGVEGFTFRVPIFSRSGFSTKHRALVNIIDPNTNQYIFKNHFKTHDGVRFIKTLESGLLIVENNQAYTVDYSTGEKKQDAIKSNHRLVFLNAPGSYSYIVTNNAAKLYKVNNTTGIIEEIANLNSKGLNIKFVKELLLFDDGILLYGLTSNEDLAFVKLDLNGSFLFSKYYNTPSFSSSWSLPIIGSKMYQLISDNRHRNWKIVGVDMTNGELDDEYSYSTGVEGKNGLNVGYYDVDETNKVFIHIPKLEPTSPLDKKARDFNSRGVIVGKRF